MKRFSVLIILLSGLMSLSACEKIMDLFGRRTTTTTVAVSNEGWAPAVLSAPTVPEWTRGRLWEERVDAGATNFYLLCVAEDAVKAKAYDAAGSAGAMRRAWEQFGSEWTVALLSKAAGRSLGDANPATYFSKTVSEVTTRMPEPRSGLLVISYWEQGSYTNRTDTNQIYRVYQRVSFPAERIRGILKEAWGNSASAYSTEVKKKIEETLKFLTM